MRRLLACIIAFITVTALETAAVGQEIPVVPGQSVGAYRIGGDLATALDALGPLRSEDELSGGALTGYYWPLKRIGIIADKSTQKIVGLAISLDDTYHTDKGITNGSDMDSVRSAYGPEDSVAQHQDDQTLIYDKIGVAFVVDKAGALGSRVSVIFVFSPGHYNDVFKDEP
jgi:hypothetical protein